MLQASQLTLYQDQQRVINRLNCDISAGEFWAIVGRNGSGKTTLLHALAGLRPVDQGAVLVDGHSLASLDPVSRAQKISLLLQDQEASLAVTVQEAVAMGRYPWPSSREQDRLLTDEMIIACGLEGVRHKSILKLSGGERRKVEIATCLAQQADFLLLDEPLNHLDLVHRRSVMRLFKEYSQSHAVVMVCHDIEVVKAHCTHVLMILENDCYLSGSSATMLTEQNLQKLFDDSDQHD